MPEVSKFRIQANSLEILIRRISKNIPTSGMEFVGEFEDAGTYEVEAGKIIKFSKLGSRPKKRIVVLAGPELCSTASSSIVADAKDTFPYKILKPLGGAW